MMGLSSENMSHRVAIRFPTKEGLKDRVFIWRRDTNQRLISFLGGRLFPGVHSSADFQSMETMNGLAMNIHTKAGQADTNFEVSFKTSWNKTELFETFQEACQFFERGNCGFSCSLDGEKLEGIRLKTLKWEMEPIKVENIRSNFYEGWPAHREGKIVFDNALMMRGIPHEWHEIKDVPELAHSS
jgi:hypothetical protein